VIQITNPISVLALHPGEFVIDRIQDIEDTKGHGGKLGVLVITNL
ncbi:Bardet-Biedl syndrome 5 protein, partial [Kipferlia bialata]